MGEGLEREDSPEEVRCDWRRLASRRRGVSPDFVRRERHRCTSSKGCWLHKRDGKQTRNHGRLPGATWKGPAGQEAWRVYSGAMEKLQKAQGDRADDMGRACREQCRQWWRQRPLKAAEVLVRHAGESTGQDGGVGVRVHAHSAQCVPQSRPRTRARVPLATRGKARHKHFAKTWGYRMRRHTLHFK